MSTVVPIESSIERKIFLIRGQKVMLDRDLAALYQIKSIALRQQVKRNIQRFPKDFMFQLNKKEAMFLVSQNVIPDARSFGGALPYVFTEQGVAMLSSVLKSELAVQVNITIMRTFSRLKQMLSSHEKLRKKVEEMEKKYDYRFRVVFDAIKKLMEPPAGKPKKGIGFHGS